MFESCPCFCERVWESQQVLRVFGSNVAVCLDVSARGCGCVKAYCQREVGAWENGAAGGDVTVWVCVRRKHCVSTGVHKAEPPGFCPPHVHGALCQRLSRLLSHSPAFSSLALPGLVQMICAKLARRALAHSSQETTCTGMAGDRAVWHQPVFSLSSSLRFSSCLLTWGQRRVESSGRGYISHTGSF